jgi:hypothetical protein
MSTMNAGPDAVSIDPEILELLMCMSATAPGRHVSLK